MAREAGIRPGTRGDYPYRREAWLHGLRNGRLGEKPEELEQRRIDAGTAEAVLVELTDLRLLDILRWR